MTFSGGSIGFCHSCAAKQTEVRARDKTTTMTKMRLIAPSFIGRAIGSITHTRLRSVVRKQDCLEVIAKNFVSQRPPEWSRAQPRGEHY
jgi:hypothetical protein